MNEDDVLAILSSDPGNSIFADFADILHKEGRSEAGVIVCLRGLSSNPSCHKGRLILSKIYYDLGFKPFCIEQLSILRERLAENKNIEKLLERLSPGVGANPAGEAETYAEAEFDFSDIELIDQGKE